MEFGRIEALRREIAALREFHSRSLREYHVDTYCGFRHKHGEPEYEKFSKTSSATCVASLCDADLWTATEETQKAQRPWSGKTEQLLTAMLEVPGWTSAGLPEKNPFTTAFLLESALTLGEIAPAALAAKDKRRKEAETILLEALQSETSPNIRRSLAELRDAERRIERAAQKGLLAPEKDALLEAALLSVQTAVAALTDEALNEQLPPAQSALAAIATFKSKHPDPHLVDDLRAVEDHVKRSVRLEPPPPARAALRELEGFVAGPAARLTGDKEALQVARAIELLEVAETIRGAARIGPYPPSTFLTQLVLRVLLHANALPEDLKPHIRQWAFSQLEHELALITSKSKSADPFALAYAAIAFVSVTEAAATTPSQNQILRGAVDCVFDLQLSDGSWPRSRPLFHYPQIGSAYCYEYEMLTQLLDRNEFIDQFLRHLDQLDAATRRLKDTASALEDGGKGWASGHHPQLPGPESWSTAAVYHFLHKLDRVLAEAVRRSVFEYMGAEYNPPYSPSQNLDDFAKDFSDSLLTLDGKEVSLRDTLRDFFIKPILGSLTDVQLGRPMPRRVPVSAIFYGPPGTSKTQLAKIVAKFLGWPLLSIDPSHLLSKGQDQLPAQANELFGMLAELERVVVFLDEFDELVRERMDQQSEVLSRFLTTAMLPKIGKIADRRRIVLIVATNHIEKFDFAIRRPGRFDMVVQVMPPTYRAKVDKWKIFETRLEVDPDRFKKSKEKIAELTYLEAEALAERFESTADATKLVEMIDEAHEKCTLMQRLSDDGGTGTKKWKDACQVQREISRVKGV
jgi:hypothetical protein